MRCNPPPNWPPPPAGWTPPPGWRRDPAWGAPPEGWQVWITETAEPGGAAAEPVRQKHTVRNVLIGADADAGRLRR